MTKSDGKGNVRCYHAFYYAEPKNKEVGIVLGEHA